MEQYIANDGTICQTKAEKDGINLTVKLAYLQSDEWEARGTIFIYEQRLPELRKKLERIREQIRELKKQIGVL